ncbi:hypothetical protein Ccrd_004008 [Cynara cardunculus var. scolymus]|uniref:Uncharacterized protein n=1 Tax=Cynara cardunculus var. scolymus TaxID=59895 RepID=A0A103XNB2_CYNCS|nr:hypothetical protein Ccrd_004008 [Cynara cardunculus var. scolymus]
MEGRGWKVQGLDLPKNPNFCNEERWGGPVVTGNGWGSNWYPLKHHSETIDNRENSAEVSVTVRLKFKRQLESRVIHGRSLPILAGKLAGLDNGVKKTPKSEHFLSSGAAKLIKLNMETNRIHVFITQDWGWKQSYPIALRPHQRQYEYFVKKSKDATP